MILKYLFILLLIFHGLFHVAGVFANWQDDHIKKHFFNDGDRLTIAGYSWLMTGVLFLFCAILMVFNWESYWVMLLSAFILSQSLIVRFWPLAKYGTFINGVVLIVAVIAAGSYNFDQRVNAEIKTLKAEARHSGEVITEDHLVSLPKPVKQWMITSGVVGKKYPSQVHIIQKGELRQEKNGAWSGFHAKQYFSLEPPAFVWTADIHINSLFELKGRDKLEKGKGNMLIKGDSFFPIANSSGKEIDQGSLLRYLAEISWFPQASLQNYMTWEEIDATHARAFMTYGSTSVSGVFTFGPNGLPVLFEAKRYGDFKGKFSLETWSVKTTAYRTFQGVTVGSSNEVTWKLSSGDFTWLKLELTSLEYQY
ncbi:hypothetical protein WSM22_18020 [Cytophagales bacterium WSM2-2]|nr:hypothetical protein WSM22_18020 [Cytophagales bacterium WSM2-2]